MSWKSLINSLQLKLSRSRLMVTMAVKLRNQCNKIIGYSLSQTHLSDDNGELKLLKAVAPFLQIVVDVGANTGAWTNALRKIQTNGSRCYLIEPGKEASKQLRNEFANDPQVSIHEMGLSDVSGSFPFFEEKQAGEQSSFVITSYHNDYKTEMVTVSSLDLFCATHSIEKIDFLKIDCEGYDFKVLLGGQKLLGSGRIQYIQFEYGSSWRLVGSTLKAAFLYLEQYGFRIFAITREGLKPHDVDYCGEYFEYSNFFAVGKESSLPVYS
jgi:FkbM family methyltransferase